ncbi:MAG TPA: histidine kinase [Solirubrobacteraceae bacterium]|nr:histidine kinase [Solirubrobacteraceae bacterium]
MTGLRYALIALAVAGVAFGLGALAIVLGSEHDTNSTPWIVLALTLGWGFIGAGLYAWWRRPENRVGPLMTLVGFLWFTGSLTSSDEPWVFSIGLAVSSLWVAALAHMLMAFPTGRVGPGLERAVVMLGWVAAAVLTPLALLFVDDIEGCENCPDNMLVIWENTVAAGITEALSVLATIALLAGIGVVLVRRWRSYGPVQRRALSPVVWTGAAVAVVGVSLFVPAVLGADEAVEVFDAVLITLITVVPFAFLLGLMRSSLSRAGAVSALFERLGGAGARDALAAALGDDTLTLAYWLPDQRRYVDADGRTVVLEGAVTEIERDGMPVAAIVHDPALLEERELVRTAGAAAALAVENERLAAEVRARYEELQAVSARLVAAGDAARRRIERDLHDGAQQRLVSLSVTLNLARKSAEPGTRTIELLDSAMTELTAGLAELRELARGIHPAVLTERGLDPALESLAARAPLPVTVTADVEERLPPAVEAAAYFVVMEALTNVAKYASARSAEVTVEQIDGRVVVGVRDDGIGGADPATGTGLAGLADRVAALGGRLSVESPPGGGTVVRADLPARRS